MYPDRNTAAFTLAITTLLSLPLALPDSVAAREPTAAQEHATEGVRIRERRGLSPRDMVRTLPEIRERMWTELQLDDDQKEEIRYLFDEEIDRQRQRVGRQDEQDRESAMQQVRELQQQMVQARRDDNTEEARRLRREITQLLREGAGGSAAILPFVQEVSRLLNTEQATAFRTMLRDAGIRTPGRRRSEWNLVRRAALDPALNLTEEQRTQIIDIVRRGRSSRGTSKTPEARQQAVDDMKAQVVDLLDESQAETFEARLAELRERPAQRRERRERDSD